MSESPIQRLGRYLSHFREGIARTNTFLGEVKDPWNYRSSSLFQVRCEIKDLLSSLEEEGIEVSDYREQLTVLDSQWEEIDNIWRTCPGFRRGEETPLELFTSQLKWGLKYFEESIDDIRTFFDRIEVNGRFHASDPYWKRSKVRYLLAYLENAGVDVSDYRAQYAILNATWEETERQFGKPLRNKLMAELQQDLMRWNLAYFFDPGFEQETDHDIFSRTYMEVLLTELRRDHDLCEIDIKVAALDRVMRFKYEWGLETFTSEIIRYMGGPEYLPPDPFWWAHSSLVLAQRGPIDISSLRFARHGPDFGLSGELNDHEGVQKYFGQAACLASLREGVEVYSQTDLDNLVVYDRASNTFVAGNEKGEIQSYFRPEATGVSGVYRSYVDERDARGLLIPLKGKAERAANADAPADLVRQALERYAEVIRETEAHLGALTVKGRYTARTPYCCKFLIGYLLEFHDAQGADLTSVWTEYEELNRQLVALEDRGGSSLREQVFAELQFFVENYWRVVASATTLEPCPTETENDFNERDALAILMLELGRDHDLTEMKIRVDALDNQPQSIYSAYEFRNAGVYAAIAADYYPEEFWWRHPKG